jgi:hypothetical protein
MVIRLEALMKAQPMDLALASLVTSVGNPL